ncbi:MAG TPA: PDZ domain-containing protein [Xanthomonadales bacterium]|nr:PDZ domain-containing protein [Xanthomonadales bacterium]
MRRFLFLFFLLFVASAAAGGRTGFSLASETSGSTFDPVLDRTTVSRVERGSLAERAGVAVGDEVTDINDRHIPGMKARELQRWSGSLEPEDGLVLRVVRDGVARTIVVRPPASAAR